MAEIFGFEIKRKTPKKEISSVVTPSNVDGSTLVADASAYYGLTLDLDASIKGENDLIKRYREVSYYPDADNAIEDIVNESIVLDNQRLSVDVVLDDLKASDNIKDAIRKEFEEVYKLLDFDLRGHDIFRTWYVDGRLYYHIVVDPKNTKNGINELRFIDPRKIRKIKNYKKEKNDKGVDVVKDIEEYYIYNDKGITDSLATGIKLSLDSVVFAPSGLTDLNSGMILSHLHKAIKPVNQLKMVEDSIVIYRISRAPERRIFYIDVGNLPKLKAEQYVNDIMNKFRNKVVYDASTGEVRDDRKHMSMLEDFWMPRREGGRGTEITTLQGGQNLGEIADVQYFQKKLYQSLNVPVTRLLSETGFNLGRASEISRDELNFQKFIDRLRRKFSTIFYSILRVQLILKGIIKDQEWEQFSQDIRFDFLRDNFFTELKENEILTQRISMLNSIEQYIGKYYSINWVRKNILRQTEDDIAKNDKEIAGEQSKIQDLKVAQTAETDDEAIDAEVDVDADADVDGEVDAEQDTEQNKDENDGTRKIKLPRKIKVPTKK